jgi:hypothetical protein
VRLVALVAALLAVPILLPGQSMSLDFARGAGIQTGAGSIFRVLLPDDVYQTVTRADLGDVRVLNATGDPVPHMLRESPPQTADADWIAVPSFPMRDAQTGRAGRTQVKVDASGAVLEVTGGTPPQGTGAYLIDASAVDRPLHRLGLRWNAPAGVTFLARVRVDGSADLNTWRTLVGSAAVAQLQRDTFTLIQSEIELPPDAGQTRYLRMSWPAELSRVTLTSVQARPRSTAVELPIHWRTLAPDHQEPSGAVVYDAHALFPVEYLDLEFADAADAATVVISSRRTVAAEWQYRHRGLFYALPDAGGALRSTPAHITTASDRYWSLRRDGGPGRAPRLRLGWHPHELLFVARGSPPFTLAYGSARVPAADAPVGAVLASLDEAGRSRQVRDATLGPARDLAGAAALTPAPNTKRLVLWSVLALAVAVLAWVAIKTFRETKPA